MTAKQKNFFFFYIIVAKCEMKTAEFNEMWNFFPGILGSLHPVYKQNKIYFFLYLNSYTEVYTFISAARSKTATANVCRRFQAAFNGAFWLWRFCVRAQISIHVYAHAHTHTHVVCCTCICIIIT